MKKFKEVKKEDVKKFWNDHRSTIYCFATIASVSFVGYKLLKTINQNDFAGYAIGSKTNDVLSGCTIAEFDDRGVLMENLVDIFDRHYSENNIPNECYTTLCIMSDSRRQLF